MPDSTPPFIAETLLIEGPDAGTFAQNQFTSDLRSLEKGHWQFSAWLDAQGRVRQFFHLARTAPDRLLLLLRGGSADRMKEELSRFMFRAKLSMHADGARVIGTGDALALHDVRCDEHSIHLGCGDHSLVLSSESEVDSRWRLLQVEAGWPWLPASLSGSCLPPALSLHRLQAVSLEKGCYPGQEIVARLHYRGGNKRQLYRVGLSQPVPAGSSLDDGDGQAAIQLLDVVDTARGIEALAICHSGLTDSSTAAQFAHAGRTISVEWLETWTA